MHKNSRGGGFSSLKNSCIRVFRPIQIFILLTLVIFGFSAYFIIHPQLTNEPVSGSTMTQSLVIYTYEVTGPLSDLVYSYASITYDNSYGYISSANANYSGSINPVSTLNITVVLNSGYIWSSDSVSIKIDNVGYNGVSFDPDAASRTVTFTRSGDVWTSSSIKLITTINGYFSSSRTWSLTFPLEDLVTVSSYSISYNLNGGSNYGLSHPSSYNTSTSSQTLTVSYPSRGGYNFSYWSLSWSGSGTRPSISGTRLTIPANTTGNITLSANWLRASYSIKYELNGGSYGSSHPSSYTSSSSSQTLTVSNPTRSGYAFSGWSISRSSSGGSSPTISGTTLRIPANSYGNITLTANWGSSSYTVIMESSGYPSKIGGLAGGFENTGWSDANYDTAHVRSGDYALRIIGSAGSNESTISTSSLIPINTSNQNHIFYVQYWGYQEERTEASTQVYWPIVESPMAVEVGANTNRNMSLGPAGQWNMYSFYDNRLSVQNISAINNFRIDFDNAGNAGTIWIDDVLLLDLTEIFGAGNEPSKEWCDQNIISGTNVQTIDLNSSTVLENRPGNTPSGYEFAGWSTSPKTNSDTVQVISYQNGQSVSNLTSAGGTITLYGVWEFREYTVTASVNNASLGSATGGGTFPFGSTVILTATVTHPLAEFLWWEDEAGTIITYELTLTITNLAEDMTRIAVFTIGGASVSAQDGGEVRYNNTTINGADYIHLSAVPYSGYIFAGWSAISGTGESIDLSAYGATADIPLSLVEGAVIVAMFEPINSTDHEGTTDNGYVDMD